MLVQRLILTTLLFCSALSTDCFTYDELKFPYAFQYDFADILDDSYINVLIKLSRDAVAFGGMFQDQRLVLEDTAYDNGFIGILNLEILQVEWILHFSDTYTFNPKAMVEMDSETLAVVGETSESTSHMQIQWFDVSGEYKDGLLVYQTSYMQGGQFKIFPESVAVMGESLYMVFFNPTYECRSDIRKRMWFIRAKSSTDYRVFTYYAASHSSYERQQIYSLVTQPSLNNIYIGYAQCYEAHGWAAVTRLQYLPDTDEFQNSPSIESIRVSNNNYHNVDYDPIPTHLAISADALDPPQDILYGCVQASTSYWLYQVQFFRIGLDATGAFDTAYASRTVKEVLNQWDVRYNQGPASKVIAIHPLVENDKIHAILSVPYSHQKIYYLTVDFSTGVYRYCTLDTVITSGTQHAIFIGDTLQTYMPVGNTYEAEEGYEVLFARDSTYYYTDDLTYNFGMINTSNRDKRSFPADTAAWTCTDISENTASQDSGIWWGDVTTWLGMTVATEASYFTITAIPYKPQMSYALQGLMQTYGDMTYSYGPNELTSPAQPADQFYIVGSGALVLDLPVDGILDERVHTAPGCDVPDPTLSLNYQLHEVLDRATNVLPSVPNGWRTDFFLIDQVNKQLTIRTDDMDYAGFTMYFGLLITLPKGAVSDRAYYHFYITFFDQTCMSVVYDTPVVAYKATYVMGDDKVTYQIPSDMDVPTCRTDADNLLSLHETHTDLTISPGSHEPMSFSFNERLRTLSWQSDHIDQSFSEPFLYTVEFSSTINSYWASGGIDYYYKTQTITVEVTVEPHACASTLIGNPLSLEEQEDTDWVTDMEVIVGSGEIQWVPLPTVSTCPDDPSCCGTLIYSLHEDYDFLSLTNQTIALETYANADIGEYTAHFVVEIEGWEAATLVYEFNVEVKPCDVTNIQWVSQVETITMYANQTETEQIFLPDIEQHPRCGYEPIFYAIHMPNGTDYYFEEHMVEVTVTPDTPVGLMVAQISVQILNYDGTYLDNFLEVTIRVEQGIVEEPLGEDVILIGPEEPDLVTEEQEEVEEETEDIEMLAVGMEVTEEMEETTFHSVKNRIKMDKTGKIRLDIGVDLQEKEWNDWGHQQMQVSEDMLAEMDQSIRELSTYGVKQVVEVECELGEFSEEGDCGFEWTLKQTGQQLQFDFDFNNTAKVSSNPDPDYVLIKFWGAPLILDSEENQVFEDPFAFKVRVPLQANDGAAETVVSAVAQVIKGAYLFILWSKVCFKWTLRTALRDLMAMVQFFQLIAFLPLIGVKFPPAAMILFEQIFDIATLKMLPTDGWFKDGFSIPEGEAYNGKFDDYRYPSTNFLINIGPIMIGIFFILFEYMVCALMLCCGCDEPGNYLSQGIFFNSTIEFFFLSYINIVFACLLNYEHVEWGNPGLQFSNSMLIIFTGVVAAMPFLTKCFLDQNYEELNQKRVKQSWDALYENVDIWDKGNLRAPVLYLVRRLVLALICVYGTGQPVFQIGALFMSQTYQVIYTGSQKPQISQPLFTFDMINEGTVFIAIYHLICFSDFAPDPESRLIMGYSLIIIIVIHIFGLTGFILTKSLRQLIYMARLGIHEINLAERRELIRERQRAKLQNRLHPEPRDDFNTNLYNKNPLPDKKKKRKKKTLHEFDKQDTGLLVGLNNLARNQQTSRNKGGTDILVSMSDDDTEVGPHTYKTRRLNSPKKQDVQKMVKFRLDAQLKQGLKKKLKKMTLADYEAQGK